MKNFKYLLSVGAVFLFGSVLLATVPPPPPPAGGPACWPPPCVPIDGGISLVIIAGAAYGARKIYKNAKKADHLS